MSLVPEAEQRAHWPSTAGPFRPFAAVQLRARHWVMRSAAGAVTNEVRGEGVIGQYPTLRPGAGRARAPAPRALAAGGRVGRARPGRAQALSRPRRPWSWLSRIAELGALTGMPAGGLGRDVVQETDCKSWRDGDSSG